MSEKKSVARGCNRVHGNHTLKVVNAINKPKTNAILFKNVNYELYIN